MNTVITSKEAILAICRKIAVENGLQALNMRTVAGACGVAVGSIYNYYPSQADLVAATIEDVWKDIFHMPGEEMPDRFIEQVAWFFQRVQQGTRLFPAFFSLHSMSFGASDKEKGRQVMHHYFEHMKNGFLLTLRSDPRLRKDAFDEHFTPEAFVDFVFYNLVMALVRQERSCDVLLEMIRRSVY